MKRKISLISIQYACLTLLFVMAVPVLGNARKVAPDFYEFLKTKIGLTESDFVLAAKCDAVYGD